eukprot:Em0010g701a
MGRGHECLVPRLCHDTRYGLSVRRNRNYEFEDDMSKTHKKHKHRHHHRHSSKTSDHHRKSSDNKNSQRRKEKELPSRTAFPLKRAESAPALLEAMVSSASAASKLETATNSLVGVEGDLTSVVPLPTGYDVSSRAASTSVAVEAKTITCRAEMETDVTCRLRGGTRTVDEGVFVISSVDEEPAILLLIETDDHHTSEEPATVVVPKTETEKDQGTQLTQDQGSHLTHDQGTQLMKLTPLASIMGEKGTCDITGVVPSILEHLSPSHLEESEAVGKKPPSYVPEQASHIPDHGSHVSDCQDHDPGHQGQIPDQADHDHKDSIPDVIGLIPDVMGLIPDVIGLIPDVIDLNQGGGPEDLVLDQEDLVPIQDLVPILDQDLVPILDQRDLVPISDQEGLVPVLEQRIRHTTLSMNLFSVPGSADSKQSTISVLVSMCKELAVKQAVESMNDINQPKESTGRIRAPFVVASIPSTAIVSRSGAWKASNQIAAPPKPKPLETLYPVSAGLQHHDNQTVDGGSCSGCVPVQSIALGELVAKRLEATARLQACLNDVVAMETLAEVEEKASRWCQSLVKPGQFTGAQLVRPMSMKEHQMGHQAWVTKSMFRDLAPVSGVGMKMLKKMGWEEGCPLGRSGQGHVEPIEVEIKMDRYDVFDRAGVRWEESSCTCCGTAGEAKKESRQLAS